jgi:hypothetical protein
MRIHINLSEELVAEIDDIAGKGKRSEYIEEAARKAARRDLLLRTINEGAGILSDEDYPHWSTTEKVIEWVRDLRDTPSIRRDPIEGIPDRFERLDRVAERPETEYGTTPGTGSKRGPTRGKRNRRS